MTAFFWPEAIRQEKYHSKAFNCFKSLEGHLNEKLGGGQPLQVETQV